MDEEKLEMCLDSGEVFIHGQDGRLLYQGDERECLKEIFLLFRNYSASKGKKAYGG